MTDYRRERQSYESRAGGDEGGQGCVKRDVNKAGEGGDWKKKTGDREGWKRLADEEVKKVAGSTSPLTKGKEEERVENEIKTDYL